MNKVIITGASGFVGRNLKFFLEEKGGEVLPISLRGQWTLPQQADAIIHLAGKAHDTKNVTDEKEYFDINTDLAKRIFNEFLETEIKDFFFFSTVKATADSIDDILTEEHISNPKTAYGKSKLLTEQYILSKELPYGKRVFIIRPCMIHGPKNKGNLNLLYKVVSKGVPWVLASFENKRSFLSIYNLNYLIYSMLLSEDVPSGIYNFADDEALSTNELIKIMNKSLGSRPKFFFINRKIIQKLAKIGDKLSLPINSERLQKLTENYVVSNQKIKKVLGLNKLPFTVEQGLEKTFNSFKK